MKLSIIVPVYNIENYIGDCLESLCNQNIDKEEYEIIVIDDGSIDGSARIIDDFDAMYSNLYAYHKENGGVSSARNLGLEKATGDYIWFVDGDDLVAKNCLELIVDSIERFAQPDILYVGVKAFSDKAELPESYDLLSIEEETECYSGWMFTRIMKSMIIYDNNLSFDTDISLGEDDVFCVFYQQHVTSIEKLDSIIYYYRQRTGSALHSKITKDNFERTIRTYSKSLFYANNYDFFWYKRDMVYSCMPNVMVYIAEQPYRKSIELINVLKSYSLFPLPKYHPEGSNEDRKKISGAKKIRNSACESHIKYLLLRVYLRYQRLKNR